MTGPRKPLVVDNGVPRQIRDGEALYGIPLGIPVALQNGQQLRVSLEPGYYLPVTMRVGSPLLVRTSISA